MGSLMIMFAVVAVLMFICSFVYKLIADAHSKAENARRRYTDQTKVEDLKDKYK